jgi:hypothetical protein
LKMWSSTQSVIALSSAEAELYAMVKGAAQTVGMMTMAVDFGLKLNGKVDSDASAAIAIVHRHGLGKLRHINVQYLWLQDKVRLKELIVGKVAGLENPADLMTKHLSEEHCHEHLERMGFFVAEGRAETAPILAMTQRPGAGSYPGDRVCARSPVADVTLPAAAMVATATAIGATIATTSSTSPTPSSSLKLSQVKNIVNEIQTSKTASNWPISKNIATETSCYTLNKNEMGNKYNENGSVRGKFDEWDSSEPGWITRCHLRPRQELFTPLKVSGSPSVNKLTHARVTKGCFIDTGELFELVDSWSCRGTAHSCLERPWIGLIVFLLKSDVRICGVSEASDIFGHCSQPAGVLKACKGLGHAACGAAASIATEGGLGSLRFATDVCNNSPVKYSYNCHNSHHVTHRVASLSNKLC